MSKSKTIIITLSIPQAYKDKLDKIRDNKHLSRSELLRRWIDENYEPEMSESSL